MSARRAGHAVCWLSLAAGYVHLAYMTSHWQEWWAYGAFFLAAAVGQLAFAPLILWRRSTWLCLAGIAGNVAIAGMYFLSRTAGPPLGPHAHAIEPAGAVDLLTLFAELAVVAVLLTALGATARRWILNGLVAGAAVAWALRLSGHLA
jgi:hypothetical protein